MQTFARNPKSTKFQISSILNFQSHKIWSKGHKYNGLVPRQLLAYIPTQLRETSVVGTITACTLFTMASTIRQRCSCTQHRIKDGIEERVGQAFRLKKERRFFIKASLSDRVKPRHQPDIQRWEAGGPGYRN